MAKKKLNKVQRREQRLRKAKQWIVTYKGTPKKIVKHYKEHFHVDTVCALKDLQEIGVEFTQEYLDAVKRSEDERLRQKRMEKQRKEQEKMALMYDDCDDTFAFIAGYTAEHLMARHGGRPALIQNCHLTRKSGSIWK